MNHTNETVPGDEADYEEERYEYILKACFLFVIMLCTIIGNGLSIAVIIRTKALRTPSGNFIISLAAADMMVGACVVPLSFASATQGKWIFSNEVCTVVGFLQFYSTTLSISNLLVLTIDRWISVTKPLKYTRLMTNKTSYMCIAFIWIAVFLIDIPMVFPAVGQFRDMRNVYICSPQWRTNMAYTFVLVAVYLLPSFTMVFVLNLRLFCLSRKHRRKMNIIERQTQSGNQVSSMKSKIVIFTIVLTFEISWIPYFIVEIIRLFDLTVVNDYILFAVSWIAVSNSFMNSVIYTCLNRKFREGIRILFKCQKQPDYIMNMESLL
ncbi:5-hydroxytryptamine receptor 1-like [Mizuhopecten yessoensis]|uniref:Trace amine-associated receptor 7a n=1 Tax=Mizuhopecten yessoensis TaxID=6573 RepID=A0A210PUV9_MIZYE|nr:5-hydroxytryptamine receptor 1-like [Mizuhopecten yessoensis]OWF40244.1 Trace amine-associated receptor 7a [Mizuhopecten yessoensis]